MISNLSDIENQIDNTALKLKDLISEGKLKVNNI